MTSVDASFSEVPQHKMQSLCSGWDAAVAATAAATVSTHIYRPCSTAHSVHMQGDGSQPSHSQRESGPYWSLMFEVSESKLKAVNNLVEDFAGGRWAGVVRECVQGALNTQLIAGDTQIVSLYHK